MQYQVTATIVTYKQNYADIKKTIDSFLDTELKVKLYIVDNSPSNKLKDEIKNINIDYYFLNKNVGFGAGHNTILSNREKLGKYHIVLNPDIYYPKGELEKMFHYMESDKQCGLLMPKILNTDNTVQFLPKLLPSPFSIFIRKIPFKPLTKGYLQRYELHAFKNKIHDAPIISGCFSFFRAAVFSEIGLYDEKFFMYFEDFDISRRVHNKYKTIYYPIASVIHNYERGANKQTRLLKIFIRSLVTYFNKWGWFWDKERKEINRTVLNQAL